MKYLYGDAIITLDYNIRGIYMNVNLPKKPKINVKAAVLYTVSIIVCIVACWLAMAGQHANDIIIKSAILEKIFL